MAKKFYLLALVVLTALAARAWDGSGTESSPYLIKNKADLMELCTQTSKNLLTYDNVFFKMTADIDLEGDTLFTGIATSSSNKTKRFNGTFDGDGHSIHGISIDCMVWETAPTATSLGKPNGTKCLSNIGFVGYLGAKGTIKNLVMARDNSFVFFGYGAPFVGRSYGTVICANHAQEGGIAGIDGSLGETANVYWDAQIAPLHAMALNAHDGVQGVETSTLTSGQPL